MSSRSNYQKFLENICGRTGRTFSITDHHESPSIEVLAFPGVPQEQSTTSFSFGLSSVAKKEWIDSRPELIISVDSIDASWGLAIGELIHRGRDTCLFEYGSILRFGEKITSDSKMSDFLLFASNVLDEDDCNCVLEDRKIHFTQAYPIYGSEIELVKKIGPEKFVFNLSINLFDVHRIAYE